MTDRFEEMSKLAKALTIVNEVILTMDHSVLDKADIKILELYNEFGKVYADYAMTLLMDLFVKEVTDKLLGKVKE